MASTAPVTALTTLLQQPERKALVAIAGDLGFFEPDRTATNLVDLKESVADPTLLAAIALDALEAADPDAALTGLDRLFGVVDADELLGQLADPHSRRRLLTVLGGSAFLTGILCRHPGFFQTLFLEKDLFARLSQAEMERDLLRLIPDDADFAALQAGLRHYKQRTYLRIGSRDLCGMASLEETTADLSSLAAACLQRAVAISRRLLVADYGRPLIDREDGVEQEAGFVVFAMGKFGGNELNFSSDIDLIYFYTSSHGRTTGIPGPDGALQQQLPLHPFFLKLAEMVTRAINQLTGDGFVFRVDLRLRPEGNGGEMALSLQGAEDYYESWGRSWERAAMIKARPVAGDLALGEELLRRLKPFVWRRYLDYAMVDDIKTMKQKIDASLTRGQERELNIKLGRGGIREIEFFAQALQLINGGKRPELQTRNLLLTLARLHRCNLISEDEHRVLVNANRFLRMVEHRIQIVQEQQTHHLPKRPEERRTLARRCGFRTAEAFDTELERHRQAVHRIYRDLFHTPGEELAREGDPQLAMLLNPTVDCDQLADFFTEHGFENPRGACDSLLFLRGQSPHNRMTERGQHFLDRLAPLLLTEVMRSPAPEQALLNLERFLQALRARSSFFALLAENRATIRVLVELFATSQFLSRIFIQHPEILDAMVARSYAVYLKTRQEMADELQTMLARDDDLGQRLDSLRRFRNEEFLRIALHDLNGRMPLEECSVQLSCLAETILEQAWRLARQELIPRYGLPRTADGSEADFTILAMGKLGGHELTYHSDLDIIFLYDGDGTTAPADGDAGDRFRSLSNPEYFARLAQRIISALTLVTAEGSAYQIDTQLRPSGNQGPLVTSLTAFERYHRETAQPWERQAMTKARAAIGPEPFRQRVQARIEQLTYERSLPANLATEMVRLRGRMEREIARESEGRFNIKTGRGGLVDVEFIVQYLQLMHGGSQPQIRTPNTLEALYQLRRQRLLPAADAVTLWQGYQFLRRMDHRLRLLHDQSVHELSDDGPNLLKLTRLFGFSGEASAVEMDFLARYHQVTEGHRSLFERILGASPAEAAGQPRGSE